MLATDFGSLLQMVTKVGGQVLATKFGFVPDCLCHVLESTAGIFLWMHPANDGGCCIVTLSFIGWAHTQNDPRYGRGQIISSEKTLSHPHKWKYH